MYTCIQIYIYIYVYMQVFFHFIETRLSSSTTESREVSLSRRENGEKGVLTCVHFKVHSTWSLHIEDGGNIFENTREVTSLQQTI
jgi:hypothetical protein